MSAMLHVAAKHQQLNCTDQTNAEQCVTCYSF